jgi:hypothetical protein
MYICVCTYANACLCVYKVRVGKSDRQIRNMCVCVCICVCMHMYLLRQKCIYILTDVFIRLTAGIMVAERAVYFDVCKQQHQPIAAWTSRYSDRTCPGMYGPGTHPGMYGPGTHPGMYGPGTHPGMYGPRHTSRNVRPAAHVPECMARGTRPGMYGPRHTSRNVRSAAHVPECMAREVIFEVSNDKLSPVIPCMGSGTRNTRPGRELYRQPLWPTAESKLFQKTTVDRCRVGMHG